LFGGWEWINDERGDLYMDKDWAEKNKEIQKLISKEATFNEAIDKLIAFREEMFGQITSIVEGYPGEAFY
jgi:hypothetical protein